MLQQKELPLHKIDRGNLQNSAGLGFRVPHLAELLKAHERVPWVEILADNWLTDGGVTAVMLKQLQERFPLSVHGVGLSLGSSDSLDLSYLSQVKHLLMRSNACMYSEHLSFSSLEGEYFPDLLPIPFTEEALVLLSSKLHQAQDFLNQQILVENVSSYVKFEESEISEGQFIAELVARTGCGVLLDINNLFVNQVNLGRDAWQQIIQIPNECIKEIHLAGFSKQGDYLIDTHAYPVSTEVWSLYQKTIALIGPTATLVEWDSNLPTFGVLDEERARAQEVLNDFNYESLSI